MNKHTKSVTHQPDDSSTEHVLTYFIHRDIEPETAGREAAREAFEGFNASIVALVAQKMGRPAHAD